MAQKVESAIDRLTEYRTALITAATTGKIDVRKVKIPQPQPSHALNAQGYFNALRSYLNTAHYEVTETDGGRIVMKEKIFSRARRSPLNIGSGWSVTGEALVINLDKKNRNGNSDPLFHFLDDNAKPWSKRCDFVVFHRVRERINVHCFEFKSATLPEAWLISLKASEAWCRALHSTIKHYTGDAKRLYLTKFVLSCHPNPAPVSGRGRKIPPTRPLHPPLSVSGHRRPFPRRLGQHQRRIHQLRAAHEKAYRSPARRRDH